MFREPVKVEKKEEIAIIICVGAKGTLFSLHFWRN